MAPFQYVPLTRGQIRLLDLLPGAGAAPLAAELVVVRLDDCGPNPDAGTSFEALSYVWGDSKKSCRLTTSEGYLDLTESLHRFLLQLRLNDNRRLLWADALCINQNDTREKESQVSLMAGIFSTARLVLADLGEASADTELAIQLMDRYWRRSIWAGGNGQSFGRTLTPEETAFFLGIPASELRSAERDEELPSETDEQWKAVKRFFDRAWFTRLWVIQEFVLARDIMFFCGEYRVDWRHLLAVCIYYGRTAPVSIWGAMYTVPESQRGTGFLLFSCMGFIRRVFMLKASPEGAVFLESLCAGRLWKQFVNCYLVDLLQYFRFANSTLERDRYFALQKISADFSDDDHPDLAPDYETDTDQLILRIGRLLVQRPNGVEMFLRAGLWTAPGPQVPSWMQDFVRSENTLVDLTLAETTHKAAGNTTFDVTVCAGSADAISLKGYPAEEIAIVSQTHAVVGADWLDRITDYIQESCRTFGLLASVNSGPYLEEGDVINALSMTVCAYTGRTTIAASELWVGFYMIGILATLPKELRSWEEVGNAIRKEGVDKFPWFSSATPEQLQKAVDDFLEEVSVPLLQDLRTGTTSGGYFANLPSITEPGDVIWIIQGCRLPVVLRKSQDRPDMFRLVGSCYCHGMMGGEVLQRQGFGFRTVHVH